jgi:hypothetical protein
MAAETIKDFLVSVGFKIDEPSERRFSASLVGAVTQATLLANALEGMARVAAAKVNEVAAS